MARPGYLSVYADQRTQNIFDEFVKLKGISKSTALTEMMEIYMLAQDEDLYLTLKKKSLHSDYARDLLLQREDISPFNDFIIMKLGTSFTIDEEELNGEEIVQAYARMIEKYGYSWFSTISLHSGMAEQKIKFYKNAIQNGETVKILFVIGMGINEIRYSATIAEIESQREEFTCPGDPKTIPEEFGPDETGKIWFKLTDLKEENNIKADMLKFRNGDGSVKRAITKSQFHFGYAYLPINENVE